MPVATHPIHNPATNVHVPDRRARDSQREIQLSVSDLEILIDDSTHSSPRAQPTVRPRPPSSRAPVRRDAQGTGSVLTQKTTRLLLLGITVLLWGAMAATALALRSPSYRDATRGSLQAVAIQYVEQG